MRLCRKALLAWPVMFYMLTGYPGGTQTITPNVAGITGSDPRPPKSGVIVAGITGSDPRPPKSGVVTG